ncbi:MAG: hypothetical protein NWE94_09115 [Candidatus Bathyarchaeota archaeon]|nr:hypothetical protein [Candidatus Bathyarchaeota archaeon]
MNKKKLAVLLAVYALAFSLIVVSVWQAVVQPVLQKIIQLIPQTSPLSVWFSVPTDHATQYGWATSNNTQVTFKLPPDPHTQFSYTIRNIGSAPIHNVTLHFDAVPEQLALLGLANQSYPLPFEIELGTMAPRSSRGYGAIIETPAAYGTYEMQWHVSSIETTYSFKIIINVAEFD